MKLPASLIRSIAWIAVALAYAQAPARAAGAFEESDPACYAWLSKMTPEILFAQRVGNQLNRFVGSYRHLPEPLPLLRGSDTQDYEHAIDESLLARHVARLQKDTYFWEALIPEARALIRHLPYSSHLDHLARRLEAFVQEHGRLPHSGRGLETYEAHQETVLAKNIEISRTHRELFWRLGPTTQALWRKFLGIPGSGD